MAKRKQLGEMVVHCAFTAMQRLEGLRPHPKNPNKHPKDQIKLLAKIMAIQGVRSPIVVSKRSGFITKGHGRREAALMNGWESFPVDLQDYEDEASEYADMIADNKIAELSTTDLSQVLKDVLELGPNFDPDLLGIPGFCFPEEFAEETEEEDEEKESQLVIMECPNCGGEFEKSQAKKIRTI